jgi:hypothetical protein
MTLRRLLTLLVVTTAATLSASTGALADSPASNAAETCAQGPQVDYYQVVGATVDAAPAVDFGNLVHGSDEIGTYVLATDHGDCVSFIAKNTKGKSSTTNGQEFLRVELKEVYVTSSPF